MSTPKTPPASEYNQRLNAANAMADQARSITLPAYRAGVPSQNKAGGQLYDPLTQTDIDTEKSLRAFIESSFPDDGINGEELGDKLANNAWTWCLDPIDGTRAFIAGVPVWSTLIGVSFNGAPLIGLIDLPALDERYVGAHGKAWRTVQGETSPLKTVACTNLTDAVLSCTEPMAMFSPGERAAYEMIRRTARFTRLGLDAYGYALIATGRMDIVIESGLKPYDVAALIPVIEGAGGAITDWHGGPAQNGGAIVCAGDPKLLEKIYPYLKRAMKS